MIPIGRLKIMPPKSQRKSGTSPFLTDWLTSIGVDPTVAAEDACRIERATSAETFTAMKDIEDEIELTVTHCILFDHKNSRCDIAGVLLLS